MADRIKGITIEINGDTTGLSKALQGVNKDLRTAQNGLRDVDKLLKIDPGNVDLLRQKQGYFNDAIASTEEKLKTEKEALEQMKNADGFDKNSEQAKALERQIIADEQALDSLKKQAKDFGSVASQQFKLAGDKVKEVGDKISGVGTAMSTHVTAPIVAVGATSLAAFKEVDAGLDIVVTKTGASGEALEEMSDTVKRLSTIIPTDFETIGTAVGEVNTRFGATGDGLSDLSAQFIRFAEINGVDVNNAIDQTQKALAAFGLDGDQAYNVLDRLNL
ncbi:MAG: phage tail tape measure protein, partial [Oscillospiraceae bacterium]|nr:phage tail tape measure protein [Oscillospiraceae bacterium]